MDEGEVVELAVYTDVRGEDVLRAAFGDVSSRPVAGGWEERWREHHRPMRVAGLWIGPPWLDPPEGEPTVVVDPGRAFGTGAHPTTRACIELLSRLERGSVLDAGCGSGVLAVAAARLGFRPVHAIDLDPNAVTATRRTATANGVAIEVRRADAASDELPRVDVVVANIELAVVEALLLRRSARRAVTSGYLASESVDAPGWRRLERLELERWAADSWQCV